MAAALGIGSVIGPLDLSMTELDQAAREVDVVTQTITEISEQTKLLALNATIEAARAGEAGKGFAVVAGEIKELARGTAEATEEVKRKIDGIQETAQGALQRIDRITGIINEVNEIVSVIAAAIEQHHDEQQQLAYPLPTNLVRGCGCALAAPRPRRAPAISRPQHQPRHRLQIPQAERSSFSSRLPPQIPDCVQSCKRIIHYVAPTDKVSMGASVWG